MEPTAARQRRLLTRPLSPPASPVDNHHSQSATPPLRRLPDRAITLLASTQPVEVLWVPFGHRELLFSLVRARRFLPGMPVWSEMPTTYGDARSQEAAAASPVTRAGEENAVAASPNCRTGREAAAASSDRGSASVRLAAAVAEAEAAAAPLVAPAGEGEAVAASPVAQAAHKEAAVSSLVPPMAKGEATLGALVEVTDAEVERYDVLTFFPGDTWQACPKAPPTSPSSVASALSNGSNPSAGGGSH